MDDIDFTESNLLKQGDIIQRHSVDNAETRIVITTNCDIRFNKHREVITTVRLMGAIEYVTSFVLMEEISRCRQQLEEKIINEKDAGRFEVFPINNISEERFLEWITESETSADLIALFREWPQLTTYRDLLLASDTQEDLAFENLFATFREFRKTGIGKSPKNLAQHVVEKMKSPPKDFVFVAGGACLKDSFGYFVNLRDILVVDEVDILVSGMGTRRGGDDRTWRRIAKIKDYFLHSILQKFGLVFGSIGMPADFEARELSSRQLMSEYIQGELNE
jgi:hypothetical protein